MKRNSFMKRQQTFDEFKSAWMNSQVVNNLQWTTHGDNHQRDFYIFDGVQITVNTCFPYSCLRKNTVHLIVDCILQKSKEVKLLLKQYKGVLNDWCLYTEEENVGVPQFDSDEDMLKFMYEVDYKSMAITVTYF